MSQDHPPNKMEQNSNLNFFILLISFRNLHIQLKTLLPTLPIFTDISFQTQQAWGLELSCFHFFTTATISCLCCGLNLVLVQNFSYWFNFYFLLLCIHYQNVEQWQIKLKPVQKKLNQGQIWTTTFILINRTQHNYTNNWLLSTTMNRQSYLTWSIMFQRVQTCRQARYRSTKVH